MCSSETDFKKTKKGVIHVLLLIKKKVKMWFKYTITGS